ncbi:hypothetical protein C2E21_3875 [Chlorella sorokiniana]|uniref:Uncharacterized protein n=1 Tax=Chlorella sorokiniana TaxID=3076 RepID=A0A2P6TS72_CHLSO|nr:hypothetical protein C2E21_3875 [Chlorella sorokiniana]|eukprot:PRW56920.1 hypothetical protein C2E21_3875 [Chlorella sorokiniana]
MPGTGAQEQPPSLQQALAVALLLRRRCAAAVGEVQARADQQVAELERLRAAAAAPPVPLPPLAQVVAPPPSPAPASPGPRPAAPLERQMEALALWHQAAAVLPLELQPAMVQAQRYVLLGELQGPAAAGTTLPLAAALEHTPVRALLGVALDILQTHAAAAAEAGRTAAADSTAAGASSPPSDAMQPTQPQPQLAAAHAQLLGDACTCLVHLLARPGQTAVHTDYEALQQFGSLLLQAAARPEPALVVVPTPDQQPDSAPGPAAAAAEAAAPAATTVTSQFDLSQPSSQLASAVLAALRASPTAGLTLLSCTAPAARDCLARLVEVVNADPLGSSGVGLTPGTGTGSGTGGRGQPGGAAAEEEALLLHAFNQLGQQLSVGLRLLPQWVASTDVQGGEFMQQIAVDVIAARDASQLISVTHPAAARLMQRVAAQMVAALQQIAEAEDARAAEAVP